MNEALRAELERRQHQEALGALVASLVEVYGPLDTPEDLDAIEHYKQLLT